MEPACLGASFPTRLSFMPALLRRMSRERWTIARVTFDLDDDGFGCAVYEARAPRGVFSLVAFSQSLTAAERSDRVIAEKWDACFALLDGPANSDDIGRLRAQVTRQEAGRYTPKEIVVSRANKSERLFKRVVEALAAGRQPMWSEIARVGYLMRTTAVYGNGKFGVAGIDKTRTLALPLPFGGEMLTIFLIRQFTLDLVEHIARRRSPDAAVLQRPLARMLGVGNATGLGMVPFLIRHPRLINRWISARETAIARAQAITVADAASSTRFIALLDRACRHIEQWHPDDQYQHAANVGMSASLATLQSEFGDRGREPEALPRPWRVICDRAATFKCPQLDELMRALIVEANPTVADDLQDAMAADDDASGGVPAISLEALKSRVESHYGWALAARRGCDLDHGFWYRSTEKEEPRLGERAQHNGNVKEMRIDVARQVFLLHRTLASLDAAALGASAAEFLLTRPDLRAAAVRVCTLADAPYGEIHSDLLAPDLLPLHLLRCKLSFLGAYKYDPKSDRWLRVTFCQGAPLADELATDHGDWAFAAYRAAA